MSARAFEIDPSGRPLKRAGFEAAFALGLVFLWIFLMGGLLALMGRDRADDVAWPTLSLIGLTALCWWGAEILARRRHLIWPGSALGIVGPLSLGFAFALSTPELRTGPHLERLAIVAGVAGLGMIPFLLRFRLPGLVSPIITFLLVGLFLSLYGADPVRMRELEGFSPRGIVAALMSEPLMAAGFGLAALAGAVYARRLDLAGDNFGLAAARPLHLVGGGVVALVAGRVLAMAPAPLDLALLALAWGLAWAWALRLNRIAVLFATHFAMTKPMILGVAGLLGLSLDIWDWTWVLTAILVADLLIWLPLHRVSRARDWTLGPGGRKPPLAHRGVFWRYWPYATAESLARWDAEREARREARRAARSSRRGTQLLSAAQDTTATDRT
ncbi:hypothetical protein LNKW23_17570 [Paralimibaculum aggregatum]|uniref:Uncharacterized protein n=1 Tax=Paralimibaculum aggregatum TaxID=3036245 RepID=A0ABQ6LPG5_9RHOB|nr:hypothetical protein [Limibaculum sp. NKW23]GMG82544.1 hypothetical protein LNKW23_17570 [Limibaculum sp. NKW23]